MELVNLVPKGVSDVAIGGPFSVFSWNSLPCREPKVFLRAEESPIWASSASIGDSLLIVLINRADKLIETTKFSDGRQTVDDLDAPMKFADLYREQLPPLTNYVIKRGLFYEDASDLTQECFLKFCDKFGDKTSDDSNIPEEDIVYYKKWLYTVARHAIIDYWREQNLHEHDPGPQEDPSVQPLEYKGITCLHKINESLGESCSTALDLWSLKWSYSEIADFISKETGSELKTGSVGTTLTRCRKKFREAKEDFCPKLPIGEMI